MLWLSGAVNAQTFKLDEVKGYPFPTSLSSSATGSKIAWAFDEQGKRNIYVAGGAGGGSLTNMALARDSKLFAARVSIHGMGDRYTVNPRVMRLRYLQCLMMQAKLPATAVPISDLFLRYPCDQTAFLTAQLHFQCGPSLFEVLMQKLSR